MEKTCENCQNHFEWEEKGTGRFCSLKCRYGFSTKAKRSEINSKVSKSIIAKLDAGETVGFSRPRNVNRKFYEGKCIICDSNFKRFSDKQPITCSSRCSRIKKTREQWKSLSVEEKFEWMSKINRSAILNGKKITGYSTVRTIIDSTRGLISLRSSWEARALKIFEEWKRKGRIRDWSYEKIRVAYVLDKPRVYIPDFLIEVNDSLSYLIEIKSYTTKKDIVKWQAAKDANYVLEVWDLDRIIKEESLMM